MATTTAVGGTPTVTVSTSSGTAVSATPTPLTAAPASPATLTILREVSGKGLQVVGSMQSNTAGGVVRGQFVVGDLQLQGGVRAEQLRMAALPNLASPLLGMDVLGRLRWQQEGGVLRIQLQGSGR